MFVSFDIDTGGEYSAVFFSFLQRSPDWSLCQRLLQRGLLLRGIFEETLPPSTNTSIPEKGRYMEIILQLATV